MNKLKLTANAAFINLIWINWIWIQDIDSNSLIKQTNQILIN